MRQMISAYDYMASELKYHLTPLPELCRMAAHQSGGMVRQVFLSLAEELDNQISPNASACLNAVISKTDNLPSGMRNSLLELSRSLGKFDLEGQLKGLESARRICADAQAKLSEMRDVRLRSYKVIGFCAGTALAILFL